MNEPNSGQSYQAQPKDPNTAFLIELVGGFFGLLGLGYFYIGRSNDGIIRLIGWIIYDVIAFIVISALLTVLIGLFCLPFQLIIQVAIPLWSANALKKQMISGMSGGPPPS